MLRGPRFANLTGTTTINARGSPLLDESPPTGRFGIVVVGAAFVLALATFLVFAGFTPIIPTATVVLTLMVGDGLVVVILIVLISIELARLRAARRAARAGARLHSRFVALFSLVAAIPAIITAIVAAVSVEWAINPRFMSDVAAFINDPIRPLSFTANPSVAPCYAMSNLRPAISAAAPCCSNRIPLNSTNTLARAPRR